MGLPFLLEIGSEEIPDWMIEPALADLRRLFAEMLADNRLGGQVTRVDATPRRLVLRAEGLALEQHPRIEATIGPPVSAGPKAAEGFAKRMGVGVTDLEVRDTPPRYYLARAVAPRRTSEVLAGSLPNVITGIYFPKTMYWTGKGGPRFIRPIRWIVALLGDAVVPLELAGVVSGNTTRGHRVLGAGRIPVTIADYEVQLEQNGVILSAAKRRARIEAALTDGVRRDQALLGTLVYLTEFPTPIRGTFDERYLELPREILTTVMRHHQRYFSVEHAGGSLAPEFVAVMNTNADPQGVVRAGNERVLRARFNDARFFWEVDQRKPLADRVPELAAVTFQARLGSYLEKTNRMAALAMELAQRTGAMASLAERAAHLAKADLTTEMVKEFTELQGIVGGLYARVQGEHDEVWRAIYEHYKPLSMEDSIPSTPTARIVSLADKLDTLRGCFEIGMVPTGSRDPFALRRAAQGVVRILVEGKLRLSLKELCAADARLEEFLLDRIRHYFRDVRGFAYDEVNAVLASGCDDLVDVEARLEAIRAVRPTPDFEPLAASFKRITNILRQAQFAGGGAIDASLLEAGPERELDQGFERLREIVYRHREARDYRAALEAIASLRPKIDTFFDKVLVNAPDARVRQNRLAFLGSLLTEFSAIADFSEIVVAQNNTASP